MDKQNEYNNNKLNQIIYFTQNIFNYFFLWCSKLSKFLFIRKTRF